MKLPVILNALLEREARERSSRPWHFGFHNASHPCLRQLYLQAVGTPQSMPDLRAVFIAAVGSAVGELVEQAAVEVGGSAQVYCELETDDPVSAVGHADIVFLEDGEVIDLKVVGEGAWNRIVATKAALPQHVVQVNGYAAAQKLQRWQLYYLRGVSIYMPGELEWRGYGGNTSHAKARGINHRWTTLDGFIKKKLLPPIPGGFRRDTFPCGWCGYQKMCYTEAHSGEPAEEKKTA